MIKVDPNYTYHIVGSIEFYSIQAPGERDSTKRWTDDKEVGCIGGWFDALQTVLQLSTLSLQQTQGEGEREVKYSKFIGFLMNQFLSVEHKNTVNATVNKCIEQLSSQLI